MKKIFIVTILLAIIGFTILFFLFAERKRAGELGLKELKEDLGALNKNSEQGYVQICINKNERYEKNCQCIDFPVLSCGTGVSLQV